MEEQQARKVCCPYVRLLVLQVPGAVFYEFALHRNVNHDTTTAKGVAVMDKEKSLWLESIGARSFPEPVLFTYTFPGYNGCFNLSERYINDTPLEELQRGYAQNMRHVELCINSEYYWKQRPHATDARELRASLDPLHPSASQQIQPQSHIEALSDTRG